MAGEVITDFAILIAANNEIVDSLPTGTRRANTNAASESYKIIIGKAQDMAPTPFCNGIIYTNPVEPYNNIKLQFIALPAGDNFSGRFVIIGRNGSAPTYWGCTDVTELVAQCTVLNGGSNEYSIAAEPYTGYLDAQGGDSAARIASCKLFLDTNGYALSDNTTSFLASYFIGA